jgi:hypothetical protein
MRLTVFLLLKAAPAWLRLQREERFRVAEAAFATAFKTSTLRLRYFDSEAFSSRVSDVAMLEADDLEAYYFAIERLRDTPLLSHPFFEIVEVIPALENGHQAFEAAEARG